jgi:hypothetical protein
LEAKATGRTVLSTVLLRVEAYQPRVWPAHGPASSVLLVAHGPALPMLLVAQAARGRTVLRPVPLRQEEV